MADQLPPPGRRPPPKAKPAPMQVLSEGPVTEIIEDFLPASPLEGFVEEFLADLRAADDQDRWEAANLPAGIVELGEANLHDVLDPEPDEDAAPPEVDIPPVLLSPLSFLCGPAGTGKTYLARAMARQLPGTILAATTGIASVNLGEGTTINALLGYFDTASLIDLHVSGGLTARLGKLWRGGIRRILLDEVSMMDGDQLTVLVQSLEELAGRRYTMDAELAEEIENEVPLGHAPITLNLIGDFAQLPPVKASFAFESPEWGKFAATTHTLSKIYRQVDLDFITAIQAARRGDAATVVDYFRSRLVAVSDPNFDGPTILATNDAVERFNYLRMSKLPGAAASFKAERWGTQRGDWKNVPDILTLKPGALVMLLANRRELGVDGMPGRLVYANGDLGSVAALDPKQGLVHVTLQRNHRTVEVDWVTRQNQIPMEPGRRKQLRAQGLEGRISENGKMEVVGEVTYMPVRVAYATTVHKSQGLSLDKVQVNTREGFFKQPSMMYVAMSRARTAEGLQLVGSVDGLAARCTVNAKVTPWL